MKFYAEAAPDLEITNLLEDGILRLLAAGERAKANERLAAMTEAARATYGAELVMVTCSSVSLEMIEELRARFSFPIIKIDYPMARRAVQSGKRIGVAATFPPTLAPTSKLLRAAAQEAGTQIEIIEEVAPEAYKSLLAGDPQRHDELLVAAIERLAKKDVSVIILAQVSMARVLPLVKDKIKILVLANSQTSLEAVREAFGQSR